MMTCVVKALVWGSLFVAVFAASTNVSNVPKTSSQKVVEAKVGKCNTVINNYNSGSHDETDCKTVVNLLQAVQGQLSEVQQDIRELKAAKGNKTAVIRNCADVYKSGERISGVYTINPDDGDPFDVYCDKKTAGGGWTVIQKRLDGSVDFYRGWADYKRGFGNLNGEFWLGNDKIHRMTKSGRNKIRIELEDTQGNTAYAVYDMFAVASEKAKYQLSLGTYSGTAGDSFAYQRGAPFSTKDQDNDPDSRNCAVTFKGGWWYRSCRHANLNGLYHHGAHSSHADGINWHHWKGDYYSAKRSEMKIRPVDF